MNKLISDPTNLPKQKKWFSGSLDDLLRNASSKKMSTQEIAIASEIVSLTR